MSTRRNGVRDGNIIFICDDCEDEFDSGEQDFKEALDEAKDAGWIARNVAGEWMHFCEDCK